MATKATGAEPASGGNRSTQARLRHVNHDAEVNLEGPLVRLSDEDLQAEAESFAAELRIPEPDVLKALRVAKDIRTYRSIARGHREYNERFEMLSPEENRAIVAERDELLSILSKLGMTMIILSVSLAAFLQGHVQVSINCASVYREYLDIPRPIKDVDEFTWQDRTYELQLGIMNASPFYSAALIGAPLALPLNYWVGRRGTIAVAAIMILASSLASSFAQNWVALSCIRIVNGVAMGLKAVSTPILASETAVRYWRGSSILMWQLWVAFGIMIGGLFNLILVTGVKAENVDQESPKNETDRWRENTALRLILGAPMVPAVLLLLALSWCMESPRYYMRRNTPNYDPRRAYDILCRLRKTNLQALRDIFIIHKAIEEEEAEGQNAPEDVESAKLTFATHMSSCIAHTVHQYRELLKQPRLRNALWSTCAVALCQQLCGINLFAFYSNTFFSHNGASIKQALGYSAAFGAVNFIFGLGAVRTIDTWGRRSWLLRTLPLMCLLLAAAAAATTITPDVNVRTGVTAMFVFAFAAVYSPGLGPIPFTLASESFPLSQREAGCSIAVASNLFFAGILTNFIPALDSLIKNRAGLLVIFSGLNLVAFIIVFLIVEETKEYSLEDLDLVFAVPKRKFIHFQVHDYLLKYFIPKFVLRKKGLKEPQFYNVAMDLNEREQKESNGEPTAGGTEKAATGNGTREEHEIQPGNRLAGDRD